MFTGAYQTDPSGKDSMGHANRMKGLNSSQSFTCKFSEHRPSSSFLLCFGQIERVVDEYGSSTAATNFRTMRKPIPGCQCSGFSSKKRRGYGPQKIVDFLEIHWSGYSSFLDMLLELLIL
jgi:hypothetical protein